MPCIYEVPKAKREKNSCWMTSIDAVDSLTFAVHYNAKLRIRSTSSMCRDGRTFNGNTRLSCLDHSKLDRTVPDHSVETRLRFEWVDRWTDRRMCKMNLNSIYTFLLTRQ